MYMKRCDRCFEPSFREILEKNWYCPFCFSNLSRVKAIYVKPGNVPPFVKIANLEPESREEIDLFFQR